MDTDKIKKKIKNLTYQHPFSFDKESIRINRYLALCGIGSRREVEKYILEGRVSVNQNIIKDLSYKVKPDDLVLFDNERVTFEKNHIYIALNKPGGYVVTKKKFPGEKNIYELIPESIENKYNLGYAGRLDKHSRGLIILSSDGYFIQHILHPRYKVLKKYYVQLDDKLHIHDFRMLTGKGVSVGKENLKVLSISTKDINKNIYEIVLTEGKKRHIRKIFKHLLYEVLDLYRFAIGKFSLEEIPIPEGKYIEFSPSLIWGGNPDISYIQLLKLYNSDQK